MTRPGTAETIEVIEYSHTCEGHTNVATYDTIRYSGPAQEYQQAVMANAYKKLAGPLQGRRVLDVGCGTGRGVVDFAREAGFTVGCDASLDMLNVAARKVDNKTRCVLLATLGQQLPFKSESFDVVISLNFLHLFSLDSQRALVTEMKRVLRPGGTLVLEFTNALDGLVIGMARRWKGGTDGSLPGEIRYVVNGGCRIVRVYGGPFPTVWRLFYRLPRVFIPLEKVGYLPPFNRFCQRLFYKIVKDC